MLDIGSGGANPGQTMLNIGSGGANVRTMARLINTVF